MIIHGLVQACSWRFSRATLLLVALLLAPVSQANDSLPVIKFAFLDIDFKPYQKLQRGKSVGPDADYVNAILSRLPYPSETMLLPTLRARDMLKQGKVHMITTFPDIGTSDSSYYSRLPLHYSHYGVVVLKDSDFQFNQFSDLYGTYEIGMVHGNSISPTFNSKLVSGDIQPTITKDFDNLIELLQLKRVEAVVGNLGIIRYHAKLNNVHNIRFLRKPLGEKRRFSIGFSKRAPGISARQLKDLVDDAMQDILESGELQRIYERHGLSMAFYDRSFE